MRMKVHFKGRHALAGQSLIELALVLPVLLILLLGVADFGRAILFNNILVNMSREGANLASRTTGLDKQYIIDALNHTASPLQMEAHGMVYIAHVTGVSVSGKVLALVDAQYRATPGDTSLKSRLWTCPSWPSGSCNMPNGTAARDVTLKLPLTLALGDEVYVVETIYDYSPLSKYVMQTDFELYSWTLL